MILSGGGIGHDFATTSRLVGEALAAEGFDSVVLDDPEEALAALARRPEALLTLNTLRCQMLDDRFLADGNAVLVGIEARFAEGNVVDGEEDSCAEEESSCDGESEFEGSNDAPDVSFSVGVEDLSKVALVADAVDVYERVSGNSSIKD